MAEIRPFRGLRFGSKAGSLNTLVAPPYDVLTHDERNAFAAKNEYNVVHLTLPESLPDDRSKYVKYARSAALLNQWRREEALELEATPALYRYVQTFRLANKAEAFTRTSIIALIKVEPYEKGVVLPHEQTFPKHKEDRMRILEATRAHLECIFGLFEDPNGEVLAAIKSAPASAEAVTEPGDGVSHHLEPITDAATLEKIVGLLKDKKVWIADGHHRYETAAAFRANLGEKEGLVPEDFMMMSLSSMSDSGLVLLPTHRVVKSLGYDREEMIKRLSPVFNLEEIPASEIVAKIAASQAAGTRAFGIATKGGKGLLITPKNDAEFVEMVDGDSSHELKSLDVTLLHSVIFEKLLGVKGLEGLTYTRDNEEAVNIVNEENGGDASFIMNPPTVEDMKTIALGGEKMPQKSTFYYPKVLSGLVVWSLNDF